MKRTTIIISILFSTLLNVYSQGINNKKVDVIDSIVHKYAKEYSIVGLSIGITHNDEQFTKCYGNTDLTKKYAVVDSTMFNLASISKLFTATAIFQLIEQEKLELDDKLVDILPNFYMKDAKHQQITIRHLLTHSSGLMWDNKLKQSPDDSTSTSLYIQNLERKKLKFVPGEKMSYKTYSNVGYDLLGVVVEKLSGQHFDKYIQDNILIPLEMHQSTFYYENIDSTLLAIPQIVAGDSKKVKRLNAFGIDNSKKPIVNGQPLNLRNYPIYGEDYEHNPSGNLISSAKEMTLWMNHNLKIYSDSVYKGVLEQQSLLDMWTIQREIPNNSVSMGFGWWMYNEENYGKAVFHVGGYTGFCSILMLYPEKNFGITILCNGWYAQEAVWNKIFTEVTNVCLDK